MKSVHLVSHIVLIILACGCKKVEPDYREDYLGTYNFYFYQELYVMNNGGNATLTVVDTSYVGNVSLSGTDGLTVDWHNGSSVNYTVDSLGTMVYCLQYVPAGTINNHEITLNYYPNNCPGTPNGAVFHTKLIGYK